jgi:hypothetical protein
MLAGFDSVWDYTLPVIRERARFHSDDEVPGPLAKLPVPALRGLMPIVPTFVWVASPGSTRPRGAQLTQPPERVPSRVS